MVEAYSISSSQDEEINTPEMMARLKKEGKLRPPVKVAGISKGCQEDIDQLNANVRGYIDLWYSGGDLKKLDYVKLVLELEKLEVLKKGKGRR